MESSKVVIPKAVVVGRRAKRRSELRAGCYGGLTGLDEAQERRGKVEDEF